MSCFPQRHPSVLFIGDFNRFAANIEAIDLASIDPALS